ncbi:MAG TPA: leucyl/phenylalanyl-tRNA--protein transferase [Arachidicoccus sp.]|nr:leucyl/phenylalanyl-tRNA--protein transferase [Arachidicoccus sp.]
MSLNVLTDKLWFPPLETALSDGLLALGGDLSKDRLLLAYRLGIFPWFEGDYPLWWSPDPRFVLFPEHLKISKSMKTLMRKDVFSFSINQAFEKVIKSCQQVNRADQEGTWITESVLSAYTELHKEGYAISAEAWQEEQLVGGLYGVLLGRVFFGESMFSQASNASKFAFIKLVEKLKEKSIVLIDCQVYTEHLESLGARMIPRREFVSLLRKYIPAETPNK